MDYGVKVVSVYYDELKSASWIAGTPFGVVYRQNKSAKPHPNCGPLGLFDTEENARRYVASMPPSSRKHLAIYNCQYIPSSNNHFWVWEGGEKCSINDIPRGTIYADEITLLEELK